MSGWLLSGSARVSTAGGDGVSGSVGREGCGVNTENSEQDESQMRRLEG